jgi:hypothetical protein
VLRYIRATGKLGGMFTSSKLFDYDAIAFEVVKVLYHITWNRVGNMTTRQFDMVNRMHASSTVDGTSFVTWMASDAKLSARLRADDSDMLRIIRMTFVRTDMSTFQPIFTW